MVSRPDKRVIVRHATPDDYPAITSIDVQETYGDMDYLPGLLRQLLGNPYYRHAVCEVDGEITGYENILIPSEGAAVHFSSGRIKASFRGQGHHNLLEQFLVAEAKKVSIARYVTSVRLLSHVNMDILSKKWEVITKQKRYTFRVIPHVAPILTPGVNSNLTPLTKDDVAKLFSNPSLCCALFPRNLFYIHNTPITVSKANLNIRWDNQTAVFASFSNEPCNQEGVRDSNKNFNVISFGTHVNLTSEDQHLYCIHIFGACYADYFAHIKKHISITEDKTRTLIVRIFTDETVPEAVIEIAMQAPSAAVQIDCPQIFLTMRRDLLSKDNTSFKPKL